MKKLLYITHLSGKRVNRFWISSIKAAQNLGYEFHLACNMKDADYPIWDDECKAYHIFTHQIDFYRNPMDIRNIYAIKQLSALLNTEKFDILHCNTPVAGAIGRICAKRARVPQVIYQAHGFHFWHGAPLRNWLIYYPIEKWLARITDVLITINQEDYREAKKFNAKKVLFVPGVGINIDMFCRKPQKDIELKKELGIPADAMVILSVGELIKRKNHKTVIESLHHFNNVWYVICGNGPLLSEYIDISKKLDVRDRIIFAGYRTDVNRFYNMADLFVFPSYQEGLSVSLMEAMASGLMCVVSDIRGNVDLIDNKDLLFRPDDKEHLISIIENVLKDTDKIVYEGEINREKIVNYRTERIVLDLMNIYRMS